MHSVLDPFVSTLYPRPVYSFTTPPAVGAGSTLRYIAWADSGQAFDDGASTPRTSHAASHICMDSRCATTCILRASYELDGALWHLQHASGTPCPGKGFRDLAHISMKP